MSPAGYWPQLRAAIEAGADAVYFGLKHFSARAKVGFDPEELPEVMRSLLAADGSGEHLLQQSRWLSWYPISLPFSAQLS
jgi:hypothetical protein